MNLFGDAAGVAIAKALETNSTLKEIKYVQFGCDASKHSAL